MKQKFGIKRICGNCKTKFYDFLKDPILCPNCNTEFSLNFLFKRRSKIEINDIDHDLDDIVLDSPVEEELGRDDIEGDFPNEEIIYTKLEETEE